VGIVVKRLVWVSFMRVENKPRPAELARQAAVRFGERVKDIRKAQDMSQEALAEALSATTGRSYHQTTVARLENATRPTSVEEAYLVAMLLGVAVTDLIVPGDEDRQLIRLAVDVELRKREVDTAHARLEQARAALSAAGATGEPEDVAESLAKLEERLRRQNMKATADSVTEEK
jgi:transcriptional regulator with XRE-family HTH domain